MSEIIWLDGQYVPKEQAAISVLTHSLHYGMGAFEGIRAYNTEKGTAIFRCQDHIDRLFNSAHILNMTLPFSVETLMQVCCEVMCKNQLASAYLRPLVFYGGGYLGLDIKQLNVQVMVAAWIWNSVHGEKTAKQGLKVKTSSFSRLAVGGSLLKAKATAHYLNSTLALQEALASGCQEALFLDPQGLVCEGSGANIFIIKKNKLYTPDSAYALAGITRDTIMTLATDLNLEVQEKRLTRDDIYTADEAFFTGTAVEIVPIHELDNRTIGKGHLGPITERLQQLFHDVVTGKNQKYLHWLTFV